MNIQDKQVEDLTHLLKSISHPIRLKILCMLQDGEMTVGEICNQIQTTKANISQHLNILRNQGVIVSRKDANFIYNRIADQRIVHLMKTIQHLFCQANQSSE